MFADQGCTIYAFADYWIIERLRLMPLPLFLESEDLDNKDGIRG